MIDQERVRRVCGAKKRFLRFTDAYTAQQSLQRVERNKVSAYECPYCHFWHIGRNRIDTGIKTESKKPTKRAERRLYLARQLNKTVITRPDRSDI